MELNDFLKCKKVKCVKAHYNSLTVGKEYSVLNIRIGVEVIDDAGSKYYWRANHFEPVLDSAENPLQEMKLTPEFEAAESVLVDNSVNIQDIGTDILDTNTGIKDTHKFEIGDKVYFDLSGRIAVITKLDGSNDFSINNSGISEGLMNSVCLATQENYERLQATFPGIKFERPPKPLVGSELAKALIKKGWVGFNCLCGHSGDENAITDTIITGINNDGQFTAIDGRLFNNAIPMKGWRPLKAREVGL